MFETEFSFSLVSEIANIKYHEEAQVLGQVSYVTME